jgi:FAD synthase
MNNDDLAIFQGRFQGFNIGHQTAILDLQKRYKNFHVFVVEGKTIDKEQNPFSGEFRKEMIEAACPGVQINIVPNGFYPGSIKYLKLWDGQSEVHIASGDDREEGYKAQNSSKTPYTVEFIKTLRPEGVSGSAVRKALKEDDFETFKKIAARGINNKEWFGKMRSQIIAESNIEKCLRILR